MDEQSDTIQRDFVDKGEVVVDEDDAVHVASNLSDAIHDQVLEYAEPANHMDEEIS